MKNDEMSHEGIYWMSPMTWIGFTSGFPEKIGAKLREACEQCLIPDLNSCAVHVEMTGTVFYQCNCFMLFHVVSCCLMKQIMSLVVISS